jgi:hypothetical protein
MKPTVLSEAIETIWLRLEEYRELKDLPQEEDERDWAEISEAMAAIEELEQAPTSNRVKFTKRVY